MCKELWNEHSHDIREGTGGGAGWAITQMSIMPFGAATYFTETFRKFNDRSPVRKVLCFFLPIFAWRDGEGNEQKLGEEWGQAKQWSQYFEKKTFPL